MMGSNLEAARPGTVGFLDHNGELKIHWRSRVREKWGSIDLPVYCVEMTQDQFAKLNMDEIATGLWHHHVIIAFPRSRGLVGVFLSNVQDAVTVKLSI